MRVEPQFVIPTMLTAMTGGGGAWACIDACVYIPNLGIYAFNNGSGTDGYGSPVENDVGGSTWD